jgi:leader peptidase (prepilin peptidase) / N-methyltransferase
MPSADLLFDCLLAVNLAAIAAFDLRWLRIPNVLNLTLGGMGLLYRVVIRGQSVGTTIAEIVIALAVFYALAAGYERVRGRQGFGLGDAKFLAAATAWLGITAIPWLVLFASISGLIYVLGLCVWRWDMKASSRIAFGPHLAVGMWAVWMMGGQLALGTWGS